MHVEARALKNATLDQSRFQLKDGGMRVAALKDGSEVALAGLDMMMTADWAALRLEINQKLQELEQLGNGYWQRMKSDLERKITALEELISLSNPCSGNGGSGFGVRQWNKADRSAATRRRQSANPSRWRIGSL
jgi:hypothetical protein